MVQDVRDRVAELGPIGAILIGGDIAFKAHPDEYACALAWIEQLIAVTGCSHERVYVVPGNHDVDRGLIRNSPSIRNAQAAIFDASDLQRAKVLREQFEDPETSDALLRPLAAYNNFAKLFSCQIYSPDHLYWKQDIDLDGGVKLRLNGLTSTLLSGRNGQDDERPHLYLSPLQTVLSPEDDVVNLVIAHHPPDWCKDTDEIEDDLNDRAAVHLFGHKHRQRVIRDERFVRIGAAAVNPDPTELQFEPGYNLIQLRVEGSGPDRALQVEAHLRYLQRAPEQYISRLDGNERVYRRSIAIPGVASAHLPTSAVALAVVVQEDDHEEEHVDPEVAMSDESTRNLVWRFWQLSISARREIAEELTLLEDGEMSLPEPERYGRALIRASERGELEKLAQLVAKRERGI
jgi:hypothetical protein